MRVTKQAFGMTRTTYICDRGHTEKAVFMIIYSGNVTTPERQYCLRCAIEFYDQHLGQIVEQK